MEASMRQRGVKAATQEFFNRHHVTVAQDLVGRSLVWDQVGGMIVETEAYGAIDDPACHTASRSSARAFFELNPPGTVYVYINYGLHWLLNVLAADGIVLIRAIQPMLGIEAMSVRRKQTKETSLCSGPGKLGQALALSIADHGTSLLTPDRHVLPRSPEFDADSIVADTRVGLSKAYDIPWRFLLPENPHISVAVGKAVPRQIKRRGSSDEDSIGAEGTEF